MSNTIARLLQRRSLRRAVQRALESGIGLYRTSWPLANPTEQRLADELLAWCRDVVSRMHRPYGVESISLGLAVSREEGRALASANYALLRPADFYGAGSFESDARSALLGWAEERFFQPGARLHAVLFSWGDLTRELLLAA